MALRTSEISVAGVLDGGGAEKRMLPPFWPSVVEEASSICSAATRRISVSCQAAAGAVPDEAGDLGLMHREDHRRGGAGAAERVAHVGDVVDRGAVAAELDAGSGRRAASAARAASIAALRKARVAIDLFGLGRRSGGDRGRALREGSRDRARIVRWSRPQQRCGAWLPARSCSIRLRVCRCERSARASRNAASIAWTACDRTSRLRI